MMSKTYVNEIDVSKVKTGQQVEIVVDAFPEKSYTGTVTSVANIGEQLPNADAKVFEVLIEVDGSDPILRPSMTTGNKIITKTISDVLFIPLESVQAGADSIPFVYLKNGTRQVVVLGESNENNVVIEQGLGIGAQIYLNTPEKAEEFKLKGEELISVIKEREAAKKAEELRLRLEAEKAKKEGEEMRGGMRPGMNVTPEMMQRFQNMRGQGGQPGGPGAQPAGQTGRPQGQQTVTPAGQPSNQNEQAGGQQVRQNTMPRDTAAMRRFRQQGGVRDSSMRRRPGGQQSGPGAQGEQAAPPTVTN
jgi:hypothetical protein